MNKQIIGIKHPFTPYLKRHAKQRLHQHMNPDAAKEWIIKLINPPTGYYTQKQLTSYHTSITKIDHTQLLGVRGIDHYTPALITINNQLKEIKLHELPIICTDPIYFTLNANDPSEPIHTATYTIKFSTDYHYAQIRTELDLTFHGTDSERIQNELKRIETIYKTRNSEHNDPFESMLIAYRSSVDYLES